MLGLLPFASMCFAHSQSEEVAKSAVALTAGMLQQASMLQASGFPHVPQCGAGKTEPEIISLVTAVTPIAAKMLRLQC